MTIYFVGSTVSDFDEFSSPINYYDDVSSGLISTANSAGGSFLKDLGTTVTGVMYMSVIFERFSASTSLSDFSLSNPPDESSISLWDGEGNNIFFGGFNPNSGNFEGKVQLRDGSTEDLTIFSNSLMSNGSKLTVRIEPGVGMSFYVNFSQEYSYSGNVGNSASTTNGVGKIGVGNGDAGSFPDFKNILAADFDTRFANVDLVTVNTTASTDTSSGGNSALTPSIVTFYDRSDYEVNHQLFFDANGEKVIYPENDTITLQDGFVVAGIVMTHSAVRTASSPVPTFTPIVKVSTTEYTGTTTTLTESTQYIQSQFTTNPATGVAWTESDLEGLGYGFSLNT